MRSAARHVSPGTAGTGRQPWDMAIGTSKAHRLRAQKAVIRLPDLPERSTQALAAAVSKPVRVAAEWTGRWAIAATSRRSMPPPQAEKQDVALDEILTTLEKLGEAIETYLDRDKLQAEAQKGLEKGARRPWNGSPGQACPKSIGKTAVRRCRRRL